MTSRTFRRTRAAAGLTAVGALVLTSLGSLALASPASAAACAASPSTTIPAVQGTGDTAAITGAVTVRGVVVGDYEGPSPALRGFYLQDPKGDRNPATSDGIFVFNAGANVVNLGETVQVTGTALEVQGQTQITSSEVTVCAPAGVGPRVKPVEVRLPLTSETALERYEGMLVTFPQRLSVTEHFQLSRFGQVLVSAGGKLVQPTAKYAPTDPRAARLQARNDLNQLIIDDATNAQNPDPIVLARGKAPVGQNVLSAANTLRGGDTVQGAVGILTFTWGGNAASPNAYRLRPVGALGGKANFTPVNQRPVGAPAVGGTITVASSNVLNYFNSFNAPAGAGCTAGVGGAAISCRGAESTVELERQAAKQVAALLSLKADVIGLMEIENDGYGPDSALADLVTRLNTATAPGTWAFIDPDAAAGVANVVGTDAIKVALLYRPDKVTPVPGTTLAHPSTGVFERNPLSQTFARPNGAKVSVVVNHFKSKGCGGETGADINSGDGQGCFNGRRTAQSAALASWIDQTVVPAAGDPDVLIIGDLNAYAMEDPISTLKQAGYRDLIAAERRPVPYSYVFDGQWGYLDYALASASLRRQVTGVAEVHVNADEPTALDYNVNFKTPGQVTSLFAPDRFRSSDHDPVVVGLTPTR